MNTVGVFPVNNGVITGNRPGALTLPKDGFTGGGQVGYNYQFTPGSGVVVGVEADAAYTDMSRTRSFIGTAGGISTYRQSMDYLGTVRGRLGYAFDRTLVYATGGFAYGDTTERGVFQNAAGVVNFYGNRSRMETGYAAGGGIEYALPTDSFLNFFKSSAVTVKAEALYYDLGAGPSPWARLARAPEPTPRASERGRARPRRPQLQVRHVLGSPDGAARSRAAWSATDGRARPHGRAFSCPPSAHELFGRRP